MATINVKEWRKDNGYSQGKLATALGVDVMTISRWEREVQSMPPYLYLALEALESRAKKKKPKK